MMLPFARTSAITYRVKPVPFGRFERTSMRPPPARASDAAFGRRNRRGRGDVLLLERLVSLEVLLERLHLGVESVELLGLRCVGRATLVGRLLHDRLLPVLLRLQQGLQRGDLLLDRHG